jgi:hypothetical protein
MNFGEKVKAKGKAMWHELKEPLWEESNEHYGSRMFGVKKEDFQGLRKKMRR